MEDLRKKSLLLTGYLEFLVEHHLSAGKKTDSVEIGGDLNKNVSCEIITPKDPEHRGCQVRN
jgi:kynureninase